MHEHTFYEVEVDGTVVRLHCNECGLSVGPNEVVAAEDEYAGHEYIEGIEGTDAESRPSPWRAALEADIAAEFGDGPIFQDTEGA